MNIIVFDREAVLAEAIASFFEDAGHKAQAFSKIEEFYWAFSAESEKFDAVIMEFIKPEGLGFHHIRQIKKIKPEANLIITVYDIEQKLLLQLLKVENVFILRKPLSLKEIEAVLLEIARLNLNRATSKRQRNKNFENELEKPHFKALVIDDEAALTDGIKEALEDEGHLAKVAYDGKEAIEKLETEKFDLVITDINMPYYNGIEIVKWLEAHAPNTKKVIISGYYEKSPVEDFIRGNKIPFFGKPFMINEFIAYLNRIME